MDIKDVAPKAGAAALPHARTAKAAEGPAPADQQDAAGKEKAEPVMTPVVNMDGATGAVILKFRDKSTGETEFQLPSRTTMQYRSAQALLTEPEDKKSS